MKQSSPYYIEPRKGASHLCLDGSWDFTYAPEQTDPATLQYDMKANVPGTVFWQLYENGRMPNPYVGVNSKQFKWVDDVLWYYRRKFTVDRKLTNRVFLCVDGSCYYTRIWLNGELLGEHDGMFGGPNLEVSKYLKEDAENEIVLEIRAANFRNPKYSPRNANLDVEHPITPWNLIREVGALDGDFNVIGPWRSIRLEFLEDVHISRPYLYTESIDDHEAVLKFVMEVTDPHLNELENYISDSAPISESFNFTFSFREGNRGIHQETELQVLMEFTEKSTGNKVYSEVENYSPYDLEKCRIDPKYLQNHFYRKTIRLQNPRLWYPAALGTPELYEARIVLSREGKVLDEQSFTFGIRTIRRVEGAGDRFSTRWDKFHFVINGEKHFLRGVNWMPIDHFLILRPEEYRWSLEAARNMGVMLVRVWSGGGIPENDVFYDLCDELGIMVWQDNFIANIDTPNWNHDTLLEQVCQNLYRIRNHASLAIHCGGNEFNPYSRGNLAAMAVIEEAVQDLDPAREWVRTTPDRGSAHIYQDMEPCWYRAFCKQLPFIAESGIHSFPTMKAWRAVVSENELNRPLSNIFTQEFCEKNPEIRNHFVEFIPERIPRMMSRASAISNMDGVKLSNLSEATQLASYEFYQVMIESCLENYPVNTGIMPWVYRRPSVAVGIQLMDGGGNPIAPYYAVRNAYQALNISLMMDIMTFAAGEEMPLNVWIHNGNNESIPTLYLKLELFDPEMKPVLVKEKEVSVTQGISGQKVELGSFTIPEAFEEHFFFARLSLCNEKGLIRRKFYWPRCLEHMRDERFRAERRKDFCPNLFLDKGPWLKEQIGKLGGAKLEGSILRKEVTGDRQTITITLRNSGSKPAFPVFADCEDLPCYASDNYFVLMPGEETSLQLSIFRRGGASEKAIHVSAWNAETLNLEL